MKSNIARLDPLILSIKYRVPCVDLLGHKSLALTKRYIRINQEEINNIEKEVYI